MCAVQSLVNRRDRPPGYPRVYISLPRTRWRVRIKSAPSLDEQTAASENDDERSPRRVVRVQERIAAG